MSKDQILNVIIAVAGSIASYCFGGWNELLSVLAGFVLFDYITGLAAGWITGTLSSRVGFVGIVKKVFIFLVIAMAHLVDRVMGDGSLLMNGTIFFYLSNEAISILENAVRGNFPIPPMLTKAVEALKARGEQK
jgi:toxin secretion/phage lysis holin